MKGQPHPNAAYDPIKHLERLERKAKQQAERGLPHDTQERVEHYRKLEIHFRKKRQALTGGRS